MDLRYDAEELVDRPPAVLTEDMRRLLVDTDAYLEQYTDDCVEELSNRIESRIENTLLDLYLLYAFWFGGSSEILLDNEFGQLYYLFEHVVQGLRDCGLNDDDESHADEWLNEFLEVGLFRAYARDGTVLEDMSLDLRRHRTDGIESVYQRFRDGEEITPREVQMLHDLEMITKEEKYKVLDWEDIPGLI